MIQEVYIRNGLSKREAEVAELVSKGLSNKEVADKLFVTEKTIKFHLTNIYRKMSISSRTQLIVWSLPYMGFNEINQQQRMNEFRQDAVTALPLRTEINAATPQPAQPAQTLPFPVGINPVGKAQAS